MSTKSYEQKLSQHTDDLILVEEARSGNERAYRLLMTKYRSVVHRIVVKIVGNSEEANDLTQETFIKAFSSLSSFNPRYPFSTWLFKIARNSCIDHLRKRKLKLFSIDEPIRGEEGEYRYEISDSTYEPDRPMEEEERRALINEAIAGLPEKYRRVILLRHKEERSYEEIASILGLPIGTVKAHIFRGRELLNKLLRSKFHRL